MNVPTLPGVDSLRVSTKPIKTKQLAVIAPLCTEGPITYKTLLECLDGTSIPYQLWLLAHVTSDDVATAPNTISTKATGGGVSSRGAVGKSSWESPKFTPVSGVDATPVAWPNTATPRVVTIQYTGLEFNQAVNWAIRQAEGDMILVLDPGLSGLMQLRQVLEEVAATATEHDEVVPTAVVEESQQLETGDQLGPTMADSDDLEVQIPGTIQRRVVERLEQWGVALQRQGQKARQRHEAKPPHVDLSAAIAEETAKIQAQAQAPSAVNRIDCDPDVIPPKKLPKFITRFHEFI